MDSRIESKAGGEPKPRPKEVPAGRIPGLPLILFYSLLSGAAALIPIPFIDEWALRLLSRRLTRELVRAHDLKAESREIRAFSDPPSVFASQGCFGAAVLGIIVVPFRVFAYLIAKLFRTVLILWGIKVASDRASEVFHRGYLLSFGAGIQVREQQELDLEKMRGSIDLTLQGWDTSPINVIFRRIVRFNWKVFRRAGRLLVQAVRRMWGLPEEVRSSRAEEYLRQEREVLRGTMDLLADLLAGETAYLESLEKRFSYFFLQK